MAAVTVVVGDEEFLVARAVRAALDAAGADAEVHEVESGELDAARLAELTSPSLFGDARVVVVHAFQDAGKDLVAALAELAAATDLDATVVLVHAGGAKGKAALEAMRGAGARLVDVPKIRSARDREQFVADEVRAAGGAISREAVTDLVAALGGDVRELSTACVQLVSDVGPRIDTEQVAAYYRGRAESSGYAVADRAVEGDVAGALETLRWAAATGVDPVLVSSSLAANLRTIAAVASAGRASPDALAGPLGMPAWKIRRAQGWVRRWRPEALVEAVQAVATADADLKGAADDAMYAVERAVLTVASCASR
ncbi:MAG TPA: DNA polymerase III subunit delta [Mycobacteriales bacterium]|nr:DNA polymerase III subunit delta [Mycobacteriales bacterium]